VTIGPGLFVAIVGPSGAGKDSVIRGLAERMGEAIVVARRVVTRPSDAHEDHDTLDEDAFARAERAGRFALAWAAHGLRYGVPVEVDVAIGEGRIVIGNISRAAVAAARARYARCAIVLVTARPEILAARLAARGREGATGRRDRLERAPEGAIEPDLVIDNNGGLDNAITALYRFVAAHCPSVPLEFDPLRNLPRARQG
jgi:ribose 1,5-bisphosphokinase